LSDQKKKWKAIFVTIAACYIYMMNNGIRNNFGIMLSGIIENTGMTFASVSLVLAIGQLCFGITQPVFGILADKKGSRFALLTGIICAAAGILLLPDCKTRLTLMLVLGVLIPGGLGAISFGVLMSAISDKLPEERRSMASGIVNGSSGIGNTLLTPIISSSILVGGLLYGMRVLAVPTLLLIPITILICSGKGKKADAPLQERIKTTAAEETFRAACKNRDYIFIMIGFFTCGFHMAIITNHLPTQILSYGYTEGQTSFAFSIYGIATLLGCLVSGELCGRLQRKNVLGTLYGSRTIMTLLFFLLPKTMPVICGYIFLLGFTGSATMTPVLGICQKIFVVRGAAIFFSFAFFIHQIGGFLSAWLAGICFDGTGNYTMIWLADILLSALAAAVSYLIREKKYNT